MTSTNKTLLASATLLILGIGLMGPAPAEAEHLQRVTKPQSEVTISGYARWNDDCEAQEPPQIYLDAAPENGLACVRPNNGTVQIVREGKANHCVGRRMPGVSLVYLPRARFSGVDTIKYTVKFKTLTLTVETDITVGSDRTTADPSAAPSTAEAPQSEGLVPVCVPLVS